MPTKFTDTPEFQALVRRYHRSVVDEGRGRDYVMAESGLSEHKARVLVKAIKEGEGPQGDGVPRPDLVQVKVSPRISGAGEPTLQDIALACRDRVKASSLSVDAMCRQYRLSQLQAAQIVTAIGMGLLDDMQASEADAPPRSRNAEPGHVVKQGVGNVIVIGDTHLPFEHKGYLDFVLRVRDRFRCEHATHVGDEVDNHALSYHESDPDGLSAGHEAELAQRRLERWYSEFDQMDVIVGNHGALPYRKAFSGGIPKRYIRTYEEIWQAPPGWKWYMSLEIDGVFYEHGVGSTGKDGAINTAITKRKSYVQGHSHIYGGCKWSANGEDMIFGLNAGCGIDAEAYAMAYGRAFPKRPTLGCGVVLDGGREAFFVPFYP